MLVRTTQSTPSTEHQTFYVSSQTDHEKTYVVRARRVMLKFIGRFGQRYPSPPSFQQTKADEYEYICSCPDFIFREWVERKDCKHIEAVKTMDGGRVSYDTIFLKAGRLSKEFIMTKKQQDRVIRMFVAAAQKFVQKVDVGKAHSVETYSDLKACLQEVKNRHEEIDLATPLTPLQTLILRLFKTRGPMTDDDLVYKYHLTMTKKVSASSLRTRRAELVALCRLRNSLSTMPTPSGRKAIVWEISPSWIESPTFIPSPTEAFIPTT
jgi:predicted nucleic acid-binding Zn finger protein